MFQLGSFILRLFTLASRSSIVKMIFMKGFVFSFSFLILPSLFIYIFLFFKRFFINRLWLLVEPLINEVVPAEYTIELKGFGAWFVNCLNGVECFTIILSAVCMSFIIKSFIRR